MSDNVLLFGSDYGRDSTHEHKHLRGAMFMTAFRENAWLATGIAGQRSNWESATSSYVTSGVLHPIHDKNLDGTEETLATDRIANPTRAAYSTSTNVGNGFFHYLQSFTTWSDNQVTFSAKNT